MIIRTAAVICQDSDITVFTKSSMLYLFKIARKIHI